MSGKQRTYFIKYWITTYPYIQRKTNAPSPTPSRRPAPSGSRYQSHRDRGRPVENSHYRSQRASERKYLNRDSDRYQRSFLDRSSGKCPSCVLLYRLSKTRISPSIIKKTLLISLLEDSKNLEEVVVTALGIKRSEKALGYAVQKVGGDKMTTVKSVDVGTALTGKIAGLNVQNSTEFNEAPSILLRGEEPLLVIDGVPYNNITLRDIASDDIESVDVLKGATASALYGSRGGSGAIMVTTKKRKRRRAEYRC